MGFFKKAINTVASGIGSTFGSIFGSGLAYKGQREANKTNIALAEQARSHDVDMWNRQNAYNTPEMQMQRLKEAGLNPNLIYGSGQASTGNADAPKGAPVPHVNNELATFANNNAIQLLSQYQDWQVKKAQIKNIDADTRKKIFGNEYQNLLRPAYQILADQYVRKNTWDAEKSHSEALNVYQDWMTKQRQFNFDEKSGAFKSRSELHNARLNESKERTNFLQRSIRQKELQIQLDEQLKPYGMSTADELWQRKLVPIIEDLLSPQKWIKNKFKK